MNRRMKIFFVDGNSLEFTFPPVADSSNIGDYITGLLSLANIVMEADGHLYFIPTQNIKYIDVNPAPDILGNKIIKGASLIR